MSVWPHLMRCRVNRSPLTPRLAVPTWSDVSTTLVHWPSTLAPQIARPRAACTLHGGAPRFNSASATRCPRWRALRSIIRPLLAASTFSISFITRLRLMAVCPSLSSSRSIGLHCLCDYYYDLCLDNNLYHILCNVC